MACARAVGEEDLGEIVAAAQAAGIGECLGCPWGWRKGRRRKRCRCYRGLAFHDLLWRSELSAEVFSFLWREN